METTLTSPVSTTTLLVSTLGPRKKDAALQHMLDHARRGGALAEPATVLGALLLRERLGTTAIGKGVAVPNARAFGVTEPLLLVAPAKHGIDWDAVDGQLVSLVLMVLSPADTPLESHLDRVAQAAAVTRLARHRQRLFEATDPGAVVALLRQAGA